MKKTWQPLAIILVGTLFVVGGLSVSARAQEEYEGDPLAGGALYAAWDIVLGVELPDSNHPLWYVDEPVNRNSWRCVACHGWDYGGWETPPAGESQEGVVYPGVFSMMGESEEEIIAWLDGSNDPDHDFSNYLSQENMQDLSAFLATSLIPSELYVEEGTGRVRGTALAGEELYKEKCRECHGSDGARINFGSAEYPAFLGNLAKANPWRAAHIIRFGHLQTNVKPGARYGWLFYDEIDLLTYLQQLPMARQVIKADEAVEVVVDYSQQGNVHPLIYAAAGIVAVILGGVLWGSHWKQE
jgi:mono/diheme cytochrome c family protein